MFLSVYTKTFVPTRMMLLRIKLVEPTRFLCILDIPLSMVYQRGIAISQLIQNIFSGSVSQTAVRVPLVVRKNVSDGTQTKTQRRYDVDFMDYKLTT